MPSVQSEEKSRPSAHPNANWPVFVAGWFKEQGRALPWRASEKGPLGNGEETAPDPYRVWVSEIMLQQTRIETVIPYFQRFMKDYPTAKDLAKAPIEEVLKHWEGLGYYSRARNLHKAAQQIALNDSQGLFPKSHGFPDTMDTIRSLPGIGEYTAGAIASIAFHLPAVAVDGNVMRVISRLYALPDNVMLLSSRRRVEKLLLEVYPEETPGDFVQGLMELGELICLPGRPLCEGCPLRDMCKARREGLELALPVREPKIKRKTEEIAVLIVRDEEGNYLLHRRGRDSVLAGLWEFPTVSLRRVLPSAAPEGSHIPPTDQSDAGNPEDLLNHQPALTLADHLMVRPEEPLFKTRHVFTHITWNMTVFRAELLDRPEPLPEDWMLGGREQINKEIMLPTAFRKILDKI